MRTVLIGTLFLMSFAARGQATICENNLAPKVAAECSIENPATMESSYFMIRVGVYKNRIPSNPEIVMINIGDYHYYYYAPGGRILWKEEAARAAIPFIREVYCDAYIIPNALNAIGYEVRSSN
jgi:hypothetical protein